MVSFSGGSTALRRPSRLDDRHGSLAPHPGQPAADLAHPAPTREFHVISTGAPTASSLLPRRPVRLSSPVERDSGSAGGGGTGPHRRQSLVDGCRSTEGRAAVRATRTVQYRPWLGWVQS